MRRVTLAFVLVTLGVALPALAQQGTAELQGRVVDTQGAVLPGVSVVARHQESGLFRETTSGPDGSFLMTAMTPGVYEVTAELASFKRFQQRDIRLQVGGATTVDVLLELGALQESITVTAQASLVDTTSKELGGYVRAEEINDVPSFNRNFTGYLGMLPGVVSSISTGSFGADSINVNGQAIQNVNYTFDGSNNNDTFNGGNGGAQARIPVEAVQEFQLLTSQFDAEFGNASGAVVNAVSKAGTNRLRGSGFLFFQDDAMTSRDYFARRDDLEKPPSRQHQWGGTVGGPIIRDRAHFFFSLERILLDQGITINVPPRPEFNRTDFEITRVWNYLTRFDHQINSNHTWGVRWLYETSPQAAQWDDDWTPTRVESEKDVDWTLVGTLSSVFGSTKVNTFRLSGTREDVTFGNPGWFENGGRQELLPPMLDYLSFQDQQSNRHSRRLDVAYAADETFSWFVPGKGGDHELKFGAQYIWASLLFQQQGNMNGTFIFNHDLPFNAADPRTYPERLQIRVPGESRSYMPGHFISGFAQDKWRVKRLSLTLGVRYDLEILPLDEKNNPRFASPDDYPVDKNNVSPRVGFSYAMDSRNRSVLRGGFGVFFQRTPFTYLDEIIFQSVFSDSFVVLFPTSNVDPGPSRGQFPTDPFLVNGPTVNRALLNSMFPAGTLQKNAGAVHLDNPDRHLPYSRQYSIGYERQLFENMSASLDYVRSEQRDLFMRMDLNPGLRDSTARTSTLRRRDAPTFLQDVRMPVNIGWNNYDALQLQVEKRFSHRYSMRGSYTWSRSWGVSEAGVTDNVVSQFGDDLRLDLMEGPAQVHRPHILSTSGTYDVPGTGGLKLSGVLQYRSATPFSIVDSNFDLDRNGSFVNDYLPAGTYSGRGPDAVTIEYKGGRRGARTDGYFKIDFRAGYRLRLPGNRTLDAFLDVFNVTNHTNFDNPTNTVDGIGVADRRAATFLVRQGIIDPVRTAQLNLRYAF